MQANHYTMLVGTPIFTHYIFAQISNQFDGIDGLYGSAETKLFAR